MTNAEKLNELYIKCKECTACALCETRTNCVFGKGDPDAKVLFVGEAPGENEDLQGKPFVGRAGKLLDKFFEAAGLSQQNVYIANILKCRPPKNRDPLPEEEDCCIVFLREQIRIIKPKIIVCLGRIAAQVIIDKDYRITKEHGTWVSRGDYLITAVYHPALLLRDPRKNEEMLKDLVSIKEKIEEMEL